MGRGHPGPFLSWEPGGRCRGGGARALTWRRPGWAQSMPPRPGSAHIPHVRRLMAGKGQPGRRQRRLPPPRLSPAGRAPSLPAAPPAVPGRRACCRCSAASSRLSPGYQAGGANAEPPPRRAAPHSHTCATRSLLSQPHTRTCGQPAPSSRCLSLTHTYTCVPPAPSSLCHTHVCAAFSLLLHTHMWTCMCATGSLL